MHYSGINPYPWILKNSKTWDHHRARFPEKIRNAPLHYLYMFLCFGFFSDSGLGEGLKTWHIFLFSTSYSRTFWHTSFKIHIANCDILYGLTDTLPTHIIFFYRPKVCTNWDITSIIKSVTICAKFWPLTQRSTASDDEKWWYWWFTPKHRFRTRLIRRRYIW